jgi:putative ABC transport system permease protein
MFGLDVDTSLVDAAFFMLRVLVGIAVGALFAGLATLPLFFLVLLIVNGWFWALDESQSSDDAKTGPRGSRFRRTAAPMLAWLIPIASVAATLFLGTYFFGGSGEAGDGSQRKTAAWGKLRFDEATRTVAKLSTQKPGDTKPQTDAPGGAEQDEQDFNRTLMGVRAMSMISLLLTGPFPLLVIVLTQIIGRMGLVLIIRSLSRNLLRTGLTYLAIFVLVVVITFIWSILGFLDMVTTEKASNLKAIITEKNQIPSQMKPSHENELLALIKELPEKNRPKNGADDVMTWAFVGGTLDPLNRTPQNSLFLFCMEPKKLMTMMDGLDDLTGEEKSQLQLAVDKMEKDHTSIVVGKDRLAQLGKKVNDEIELTSFNYTDMVFKLKIIGVFPEGRYDQSAIMNREYLKRALLEYPGTHSGKDHPLADKSLNLIWVRLPDKQSFELLAEKVNSTGKFNPAVKIETASSAIGSFLEPMKDVIKAMRFLVVPALMATMTLVIANAISISVRERRTEMAVLKVLGFRPWMVMSLVLGEAVLVGALSGFMATATAFAGINATGGIPFPIAFFPKFLISTHALWWGPAMGASVAVLGSILPAWTARSVKVSEVFSKVA